MKLLRVLMLALISARAYGEVVSATANGFCVKQARTMKAKPEKAFASFVRIQSWWDSEHTYSGNAANLSLDARPGGCFCEKLPDGGVLHMTIIHVQQNHFMVLSGGLGPLQTAGLAGAMSVQFKPAGENTEFVLVYNVGGYHPAGLPQLAASVDEVLGIQIDRLKRLAETGSAEEKK